MRLLDHKLQVRHIVRWTEYDRKITAVHMRAWRDEYIESQGGRFSPNWNEYDEAMIDSDRSVLERFPAFIQLQLGRDERLWVLPYPRPRQEPRDWMAFEADGNFSCHLPSCGPNFDLHEFGADYVLGVARGRNSTALKRVANRTAANPALNSRLQRHLHRLAAPVIVRGPQRIAVLLEGEDVGDEIAQSTRVIGHPFQRQVEGVTGSAVPDLRAVPHVSLDLKFLRPQEGQVQLAHLSGASEHHDPAPGATVPKRLVHA